nr:hypothetical protein [Tanacetum cinerariifolium]
MKCATCKSVGHLTWDCRVLTAATNQRALVENQRNMITCYECGKQGHYKSDCPKLKSQNRGNAVGSREARGRVYALGGGDANQDSNVVTGIHKTKFFTLESSGFVRQKEGWIFSLSGVEFAMVSGLGLGFRTSIGGVEGKIVFKYCALEACNLMLES